MSDFLSQLQSDLVATSGLEYVAVVFGVLYIALATRQNVWCWPAALVGTGTSIVLFWDASLLMESALNVYYLMMAIYGWWQWVKPRHDGATLAVRSFSFKEHCLALVLILALTQLSGYLLEQYTSAARPFLDSFTSWAAVVTTWMVAHKILENWLYWIVINSLSIYLYLDRGLALYALLFLAYIVISVLGYLNWRRSGRTTLAVA